MLKRIRIILFHVRSLPEESRRFIALVLIVMAGFIVFGGWSAVLVARLQNFSQKPETGLAGEVQSLLDIPPPDLKDPDIFFPDSGLREIPKNLQELLEEKE